LDITYFCPQIKFISMKKTVFILFLAVVSLSAFSQQAGNLSIGAKGGYLFSPNYYKGALYGFDVAYHLSSPLEVAFTGLMNSNISYEDINNTQKSLAAYSANLDFRLYLVNMQQWATGPALGGQYYIVNVTSSSNKNDLGGNKAWGFNIGWHARFNLTDNLKLNGGWRYTNAKAKDKKFWWSSDNSFDMSHHLFYVGLSYTFELGKR